MSAKEEEWQDAPAAQKMQRMETLRKDKVEDMVQALGRAQSLHVPNTMDPGLALQAEEELSAVLLSQGSRSGAKEQVPGAEKKGESVTDEKGALTKDTGTAAAQGTSSVPAAATAATTAAVAAAAAATAPAVAAVEVAGGEAADASDAGVQRQHEGRPAADDKEPAAAGPASDSSVSIDPRAADLTKPESQRPASRKPGTAISGKWSRLIDELIAQENAKAGEGQEDEEAAHRVVPKVQKMVRKWSLVRRAVDEGELQEGKEKGKEGEREGGKDKAEGLESVPEEPQADA